MEKKNKGKIPTQDYSQNKRFPAGPFAMHEGASFGIKPSGSTSLQGYVPAEMTYSSGDMIIALQEVLSSSLQFHNGVYSELPDSIKYILDNLYAAFTRNNRLLFEKTLQALEIHLVDLTAQNEAYISHYANLISEKILASKNDLVSNLVKRKWLEKMKKLKKHILFFDFLENHYVSKDEVSKQHLNVIKKSNFFKIDKTIIRSNHPPLDSILITTKKDEMTKEEVKVSPFKIANDQTPIVSLIEQNNFTNQSLYIIGQHLDHIEEKIVEKPVSEKSVSVKTEKPLIDLPSQREKVMFKTS